MNATATSKIILILSVLGIFNIANAQQYFNNEVNVSENAGFNWPSYNVYSYGGNPDTNGAHPIYNLIRANGTITAPTFTKQNDILGVVGFTGYSGLSGSFNGSNLVQNVRIVAYALSDYTNGNYANRLDFQVGGNAPCCGETRMSINGVTGNVGIGTQTPGGKLDINLGGWGNIPRVVFKSVSDNPGINFYRPTGSGATAYPWRIEENIGALEFQTGATANIGSETFVRKFYIDNSKAFFTDNVGIGTENPAAKLHVSSSVIPESSIAQTDANLIIEAKSTEKSIDKGATLGFVVPSNTDGGNLWQQGRILVASDKMDNFNADGRMYIQTRYFNANNTWDWNNNLVLRSSGNVGIGTANPDSKLTVKGSIHAEEVKVDLAVAPDYVFEKYYNGYSTLKNDYKMPTLEEVEAYTKENKHLPEVPSAQEIKENGLKLGEMNAILLQKVEELTLYLIEQNKEIEKLKTKVDELSKK